MSAAGDASERPPEPPAVDPEALRQVAEHADAVAAWLEREQVSAALRGHPPDFLREQVDGWRFVGVVAREWNDDA